MTETCPRKKPDDDDGDDRWLRTLRAAVRCQPLMYAAGALALAIWWAWSDAKSYAQAAASEVQDAKRAAISAKYEARDVKEQVERVDRNIDRQLQNMQRTLDRLVDHMILEGKK